MRALVADADAATREDAASRLAALGHETEGAADADALLDAAVAAPFGLALVALDLPGSFPGIEAAKLLAFSTIGRARAAIYGLSPEGREDDREACRRAGLDGCLAKPLVTGELAAATEAAASPRPAPQPLPEGVHPIAGHPRYRQAVPVLDLDLLHDLEALGGAGFLAELADEFLQDAAAIRAELDGFVERGDAAGFRARVQALRSAAANVGAQGVFSLCLSWRQTGRRQLAASGRERLRMLDAELARTRRALAAILPGPRSGAGA